mmetsp:Transcript_44293/g.122610  ORF Transcript_44293/g.122610 Transcript_44293/m.122610 type:complete len:207 (+) Transcript_44293:1232-1852(+)
MGAGPRSWGEALGDERAAPIRRRSCLRRLCPAFRQDGIVSNVGGNVAFAAISAEGTIAVAAACDSAAEDVAAGVRKVIRLAVPANVAAVAGIATSSTGDVAVAIAAHFECAIAAAAENEVPFAEDAADAERTIATTNAEGLVADIAIVANAIERVAIAVSNPRCAIEDFPINLSRSQPHTLEIPPAVGARARGPTCSRRSVERDSP